MKINLGTTDRVIRILLAALLFYLYATDKVTGTAGIIFLIFSGVLVITSMISFCPVYSIFGLSTKPAAEKKV